MNENNSGMVMTVPAFRHCKELKLNMGAWNTIQSRMGETERLVPSNYSAIEYIVQAAWREARNNCNLINNAIKKAKTNINEIKADIILTDIPKMLENMPKNANNADFRNAVFAKSEDYQKATEHLEKLEAMLAHFESHLDSMKETSRILKKQMDYFNKTGVSGSGY